MILNGYKQTEIGVIPEDWQVSTMESLTSLMTNGFVGTIKSEYVPSGMGVLYLQGFNIKENGFDLTGVTYVSDAFHKKHLKSELKENDLLTIQTGDIGVTSYLPKQFEGANCQALIISRFYEKYDSRFWSYYFNSIGRKALKLIETGTTMKHINVGDMKGVLVPVPTNKTEQTRIAEALSDVDSMISSLEKLIAKKKAIKQGTMQELLTGKKRLPGFTGKWEKIVLKELINEFIVPMRDKPKDLNGPIPWCRIEDFNGKYLYSSKSNQGVTIETINNMNLKVFPQNTLLVSCSAYLGRCAIVKSELVTNQTFIGLVPGDNINVDFLFYVMNGEEKNLNLLSSGTTISYLSREQFEEYKIYIPCEVSEQTAIASILSDMDNEIEALEQKLAKTRQIKQGMMQQLLTGKIRLA